MNYEVEEGKFGTFTVTASMREGMVILGLPDTDHAYGLSPENAAEIGMDLATSAMMIADKNRMSLELNVSELLLERLIPIKNAVKKQEVCKAPAVVNNKDMVTIVIGEESMKITPADARAMAKALLSSAIYADRYEPNEPV